MGRRVLRVTVQFSEFVLLSGLVFLAKLMSNAVVDLKYISAVIGHFFASIVLVVLAYRFVER